MVHRGLKTILIFVLCTTCASVSFAQTPAPQAPNATSSSGEEKGHSGPRRQLATIVFAGLGGAVLGLSTLSFYGRPQDRLQNIAIGFAFGVIAGTAFVTYKAATSPAEFYGPAQVEPHLPPESLVSMRDTADTRVHPLGLSTTFEF